MRVAKAVSNLIESFERLPGIGPKTAARLTYYLLHVPEGQINRFSDSLKAIKTDVVECSQCHNIAETDPCDLCSDQTRDTSIICVVEQPLDVLAFERGGGFRGLYHVLHGTIDPLHNIGPDEIRISSLMRRIMNSESGIVEIILALNPNMEGEATAMYIKNQISKGESGVKVTRLGQGLPMGADIEYADEGTLSRALEGRREL